jgi:hypothetical protein
MGVERGQEEEKEEEREEGSISSRELEPDCLGLYMKKCNQNYHYHCYEECKLNLVA